MENFCADQRYPDPAQGPTTACRFSRRPRLPNGHGQRKIEGPEQRWKNERPEREWKIRVLAKIVNFPCHHALQILQDMEHNEFRIYSKLNNIFIDVGYVFTQL